MKCLTATLIVLALLGSVADAARRSSGGGFGGRRSLPRVSVPRVLLPRNTAPRPTPNGPSRTSSATQRGAALPSTASVRSSPLNRAAAARVTPAQVGAWKSAPLPAGVPRTALTYSAARSSTYQYQLQNGRYYPYPQAYYRSRGIGADLLRYAVIFMAVDALADAATPDRRVPAGATTPGTGDLSDVPASTGSVVTPSAASGPDVWAYGGIGLAAAGAGWLVFGRRRDTPRR